MRLLLLFTTSCWSSTTTTPPAQPKPLAPSDVGLSDEPVVERTSPPEYISQRGPSGYFRHEECPPDPRGCWIEQDITDESVRVRWRCRYSATIMQSGRALKTLRTNLVVGDGGLDRSIARRVVLRAESDVRRCFDLDAIEQHVELRFTIHRGHLLGLDTTDCLRKALGRIEAPSEPSFTPVHWTLDYTIEDPANVSALVCQ